MPTHDHFDEADGAARPVERDEALDERLVADRAIVEMVKSGLASETRIRNRERRRD